MSTLNNNHVIQTSTHPTLTPSRTVVTSFNPRQRASTPIIYSDTNNSSIHDVPVPSAYEEGDWVLCLASSSPPNSAAPQQSSTISCALSNGKVQVYDQTSLLPIVSYRSRVTSNFVVTDMKYGPQDTTSPSLLTTGNDGSFVMKDLRQPSDVIAHSADICSLRHSHNESLLSLAPGYDGFIVALSSSKRHVHFIDLRKMSSGSNSALLLGSYVNAHRDAVTQVQFHPERTSVLMSAGEDGLICLYDTIKPSEDLALETVINTGTPCRKAGFCGKYVFCLTGSETASIWDCNTAACLNDFGNFALRDALGSKSALPINYLVDAKWDSNGNVLLLCAGNHEGNTAIFSYDVTHPNSFWEVHETLLGGHHGIVRAWCPSTTYTHANLGTAREILYTAGEDARICEWNSTDTSLHTTDASMLETETMETNTTTTTSRANTMNRMGGPIRRQRRSSKTAAKPY